MSTNREPNFIGTALGVGGRTESTAAGNTDGSNVNIGGCGPEDQIATRCVEELEVDALVLKVFGVDGVQLWDTRPFFYFGDEPILYVAPTLSDDEQVPAQEARGNITLEFGIRYPIEKLSPRRNWEPGLASLVRKLQTIINLKLQTVELFINDQECQIAQSSVPGEVTFFIDADADRRKFAAVQFFTWTWRVLVNLKTGLPINVSALV